MSDLDSRLAACFSAVFPDLSADAIAHATVDSIPSWDSMATLTLTGLIEEEFKVGIDPRDRERLTSFALILDYLRSEKRVS